MISPGVCNHQEPRLTESCLDLVCEGARGETPSNRSGPSGSSKLQNCTLQKGHGKGEAEKVHLNQASKVHFSQVTQALSVNVHEI